MLNHISERNFSPFFENLTSLTGLSLRSGACQGAELIKVIGKINSLTSLNLCNNLNIPEMDLVETLKRLTQLKYLDLYKTTITLKHLPLAIEKMKSLEQLNTCHDEPNNAEVVDLITVLKQLTFLKSICTNAEMKTALRDLKDVNIHKF